MGIKLLFFLNMIGATIFNWAITFLCILFMSFFTKKELFPSDNLVGSALGVPILLIFFSPILIFFVTAQVPRIEIA